MHAVFGMHADACMLPWEVTTQLHAMTIPYLQRLAAERQALVAVALVDVQLRQARSCVCILRFRAPNCRLEQLQRRRQVLVRQEPRQLGRPVHCRHDSLCFGAKCSEWCAPRCSLLWRTGGHCWPRGAIRGAKQWIEP